MRRSLSELKAAPLVWVGVWLSMIASQTMLCSIFAVHAVIDMDYHGRNADDMASNVTSVPMVFTVVAAVLVLLWVISSALDQRRHQLALLVLQGAMPWQLLAMNILAILILFILAAVVSCLLTPLVAPIICALITNSFDMTLPYRNVNLPFSLRTGLIISGATTLIGTVMTVRSLGRIRPMEALRQSWNPPGKAGTFRTFMGGIFLTGALCLLAIPGLASGRADRTELANILGSKAIQSKMNLFLGTSMGAMFLLIFSLAAWSPYILPLLTRGWTNLIPLPSPTWVLARQQAVGRIQRQGATIIPMAAGLSLLMSFSGILLTLRNSMAWFAPPGTSDDSSSDGQMLVSLAAMLGPALVVTLAGVISGLLITSRGRSLDLALTYVSGAEVGQLRILGSLDGAITMVTATLLSFIVTLICTGGTAFNLFVYLGHARLGIQWSWWAAIVLCTALVGGLATGLQAAGTHFEQSTRIIAQAIGQ